MKSSVAIIALGFMAIPSLALAQSGTATGIAGGAATGAVVGGPVGAVVGGAAGAVVGTAIDPPPQEVQTYVIHENTPSVAVQGDVETGYVVPETVELHTVPKYRKYSYAVINDQRVIVDPGTRKVITVVR
jgi:hypothetical protein